MRQLEANKAISIKPDFAQTHNNLGNALKDQNMLQEAIKAYEKRYQLILTTRLLSITWVMHSRMRID